MERLEPFVGEWSIEAGLGEEPFADVGARATWEWLPGERFLVQRWTVPIPDAPDGIAVIGLDESGEAFRQHYFDSRGVARIYAMTFEQGVWTLSRTEADLSPLDFAQRYRGVFSDDGSRIDGRWEIAHDRETWELDFELSYRRLG
jgi:hypothetical protein